MFSVVAVFNDPDVLERRLKAGLARQRSAYQLIAVDNTGHRFPSAAAALNHGAQQAEHPWILFVHQDVELIEADWLDRAEGYLASVDPNGWHGLVGRTKTGRWRGIIRDRDMVFGEPFDQPIPVMTLDEIVLIHRNRGAAHAYFDEALDGWHAYGVDACCQALRDGAVNTVLPMPVWHDSRSINRAHLDRAHRFVWQKHRAAFSRIYTTCGVLPNPYGWSGSYKISTATRRLGELRYASWLGQGRTFDASPFDLLDDMTRSEPVVHVFHSPFRMPLIEGRGFAAHSQHPRRVVHHFESLPGADASGCIVIAPDLADAFFASGTVPARASRVLVAAYVETAPRLPEWEQRFGKNLNCQLAMEPDETRWAVMEFSGQAGANIGTVDSPAVLVSDSRQGR